MTQARKPRGTPVGGQFAPDRRRESQASLSDSTPPLADYEIVGMFQKTFQAAPGAPVRSGGTCWHCGLAITNCVRVRHRDTGEEHDIGTTCAERAGLSRSELKAMLSEKYAEERYNRALSAKREGERKRQEEEAEGERLYGPHGTESRFSGGCRCDGCRAAAPHGSLFRLEDGECQCDRCVEAAVDSGEYRKRSLTVLLDSETGEALPARLVTTRYGNRWAVDDPGGDTSWYPYRPERRSTMTKRGVVEAEVEYLVRPGRGGGFHPMFPLHRPVTDRWGESVTRSGDQLHTD